MKRNLLKAIGISFLIFVVLSWIIPVGTYADGKLTTNGIDAVGLFDLFGIPVTTIMTFAMYILVFAVIGGLYGVMEKTGALPEWIKNIRSKFEGKETGFLVFTILFFVILSSVTGLIVPLFVLVPLFAGVLFAMNYNKITAMAATVGSLLVGSIGSTYGFNITGYTKNILSVDMSNEIWAKLVILVLVTALFIFFVLKFSKRKTNTVVKVEVKKDVKAVKAETKKAAPKKVTKKPAAKKTTTTKKKKTTAALAVTKDVKKVNTTKRVSTLPLIIIIVLLMIVSLVGMYNWYYSFGIDFFNDLHASIMGVKIGDFPIFEHLLSGISEIGYWGNAEFIMLMVIAAILIAWVYKLRLGEFVESFIAGMKKWLPTAIYAGLASVILTVLYQASYAGSGTLVDTLLAKTFNFTDDFNAVSAGLSSLYGSFFFNDLYYLLAALQPYVASLDGAMLNVAGLVIQSMYALGMLIFPTSVILIAGLSYFDVKFGSWFKFIWKFALAVLVVLIITCCILTVL